MDGGLGKIEFDAGDMKIVIMMGATKTFATATAIAMGALALY